MFRPETRDRSTVNVYHGDNEDCPSGSMPLDFLPRVGDFIDLWTSRDEHGNYYGEDRNKGRFLTPMRNVIKGKVTRIEHVIEERGMGSNDHSWVQHVNIYTEPLPLINDGKPC